MAANILAWELAELSRDGIAGCHRTINSEGCKVVKMWLTGLSHVRMNLLCQSKTAEKSVTSIY